MISHHGATLVLDGAHNPHAAAVLVETWNTVFPGIKPSLVFAAVSSKDVSGVLSLLAPLAERIFFCPVNSPRSLGTEELLAATPDANQACEAHVDFVAALDAALKHAAPVLIAGSLYLVGQAKAHLSGADFQSSAQ
jgi:dihydrofolate synthase/folylpolyglutamate synthase